MEKLRLDDFTKYSFLSNVKYDPSGKKACFILHQCDMEENNYFSNLWIYDLESDNYRQLTASGKDSMFLWEQSGKQILFTSLRNPKDQERIKDGEEFTQFYQISVDGGEAVKSFCIPKKVTSIHQIDRNTYVFTATFDPNQKELFLLSEDERRKELKKIKEEKDYEVLEEIPFWSNGGGFSNKKRNRLYLFKVNTNSIEPITDEITNISSVHFNQDKTKLVFISHPLEGKMEIKNDIYLYNINSGGIEKIPTPYTLSHGFVDFIQENMLIYTGKDMKKYGLNENSKFYTYDIDQKETACITPDFDYSMRNTVGSDCRYGISHPSNIKKQGTYVYFITTEGFHSYLNRVDTKGNIERLTASLGSIDDFAVNREGHILFIGLRNMELQELYLLEDGEEKAITKFNRWVTETKKIITPEKIQVKVGKDLSIDGWILRPIDFNENLKYPAILNIHGGPKTVYGEVYYHEMQYWANEGYVVFFCNPRGSDGRGNEFADIRGKYGTIDYDDIMKFTDAVMEYCPFIDETRVGVTGGSYGGFMTNWIIGHTHRFKAAASQRSISNWISKFGTTDIGYYFNSDQIGGNPWENQEKMWYHSPLKYADQVKTPTLFIHSEEDYRCWLPEGIQMFTALKYHHVEARLCMFRGENHELSRSGKPKHRIRRLEEIVQWFNHYLKEK